MGTLANAFALLADEEGNEASIIVALKSAEFNAEKKKISEEKKRAVAKKQKKTKSSVKDRGRGKEGHGHGQKTADQRYNGHLRNRLSNGSGDRYGQGNGAALSKEELHERWLAREEERKKDMAMKTLKEYEEQKAYEKQQKAKTLSACLSEETVDDIHIKEKSKDETVKKGSNIDKDGKSKDETVKKDNNTKKYLKGSGRGDQKYALPDEDNTVKVKAAEPVPDLSETSFPVLCKVTKPIKFYWEDSGR